MKRTGFLTVCLLTIIFMVSVKPAMAFSFSNPFGNPQTLLTRIGEKLELIFAFTPSQKVTVLEKQAERRLTEAKGSAKNNDTTATEASVKAYENLKNQQAPILNNVEQNVIDDVKDRTINQQETLLDIVDLSPDSAPTVSTTNKTVVENIKKTVEYKEGTTAGGTFEDKATIVYAPGTGPGGEGGGIKIEGGELHTWAPGTGPGGESGVTYEGGALQVWAPGTSGGGEGRVVVEGGPQTVVTQGL